MLPLNTVLEPIYVLPVFFPIFDRDTPYFPFLLHRFCSIFLWYISCTGLAFFKIFYLQLFPSTIFGRFTVTLLPCCVVKDVTAHRYAGKAVEVTSRRHANQSCSWKEFSCGEHIKRSSWIAVHVLGIHGLFVTCKYFGIYTFSLLIKYHFYSSAV